MPKILFINFILICDTPSTVIHLHSLYKGFLKDWGSKTTLDNCSTAGSSVIKTGPSGLLIWRKHLPLQQTTVENRGKLLPLKYFCSTARRVAQSVAEIFKLRNSQIVCRPIYDWTYWIGGRRKRESIGTTIPLHKGISWEINWTTMGWIPRSRNSSSWSSSFSCLHGSSKRVLN